MADGEVTTTLISARPTVRIEGQAFPLLSSNIVRMRMRERAGGMSSLELCFVDWLSREDGEAGYGATAGSPLKLGAGIMLYAGAATGPQEIFDGFITALEGEVGTGGPPTFTILAEDALWKARRARRSRTFEDLSPADLVRRIAGDHGMTPKVRDGLDQPVRTWTQMNESDLAFLRRVLEPLDADLQAVAGELHAGPLAREARVQVELRLGGALVRARVTADLADQATKLVVSSFDPATGEAVSGEATAGDHGPGHGRRGAELLQQAVGEVPERIGTRQPMTQGEADKLARAAYSRRARRFVRVDATAQGDARIRVGTWAAMSGLNPMFANTYVVTEAVHRFDGATGYLTDFIAESAYLGEAA
jgi:phage protein D